MEKLNCFLFLSFLGCCLAETALSAVLFAAAAGMNALFLTVDQVSGADSYNQDNHCQDNQICEVDFCHCHSFPEVLFYLDFLCKLLAFFIFLEEQHIQHACQNQHSRDQADYMNVAGNC